MAGAFLSNLFLRLKFLVASTKHLSGVRLPFKTPLVEHRQALRSPDKKHKRSWYWSHLQCPPWNLAKDGGFRPTQHKVEPPPAGKNGRYKLHPPGKVILPCTLGMEAPMLVRASCLWGRALPWDQPSFAPIINACAGSYAGFSFQIGPAPVISWFLCWVHVHQLGFPEMYTNMPPISYRWNHNSYNWVTRVNSPVYVKL